MIEYILQPKIEYILQPKIQNSKFGFPNFAYDWKFPSVTVAELNINLEFQGGMQLPYSPLWKTTEWYSSGSSFPQVKCKADHVALMY